MVGDDSVYSLHHDHLHFFHAVDGPRHYAQTAVLGVADELGFQVVLLHTPHSLLLTQLKKELCRRFILRRGLGMSSKSVPLAFGGI